VVICQHYADWLFHVSAKPPGLLAVAGSG
jgi:hypothetical protein